MATILAVDDHQPSLELMVMILKYAGYDVLEASDGVQATEIVKRERPDVVVLDIDLGFYSPSGIDVTRQLRRDPMTADTLILVVSAMAMKGDERRFREVGCDGYVSKPFDIQHLLKLISEAMCMHGIEM